MFLLTGVPLLLEVMFLLTGVPLLEVMFLLPGQVQQ